MQSINTKTISTEAEFKAACIADGDKVIPILHYMINGLQKDIFAENTQLKRDKIYFKYNDLKSVVTEIENARHESAPQLNF